MSSATSLPFGVNDTAVRTSLASGITSTDTSVDVGEVTNPPATPFLISVFVDQSPLREDDMEIMEVTSISGTTLTVNRGQKGTSAQSFSSGDKVFVGVLPSDFVDDPALPAAEKTTNPFVSSFDFSVYTSGPSHGEGGNAFFGAVQAGNGRVILAPNDSNNVGIFDPASDSYTSGPSHGEGRFAFSGAAQAGDGRVILAPNDSNNVGIFDPASDSYTSGPSHGERRFAFSGAAQAGDGRIILAPRDSSNVGIFDPSNDTYTSGPSHGERRFAFIGAAQAGDGRVILAPNNSSNVGIFDPSNDSYTSGPSHGEGGNAFIGAAQAGDGRIIFAPFDSNNVGIFDPSTDSYTSGPSHGEGGGAFNGAAQAGDGRVILAPDDSSNVGIFDPSSDTYTSGPSHGEGINAFRGAAQAGDGRVILAPNDSNNVGISGSPNFTKDPVPADLSKHNVVHVARGADGPIEINAKTFGDGRRSVAYVSVENAGAFGFSVVVDGGSGTFKWSGAIAPTLASGSGVVSVIGLKQTGPNEVTGFAVEQ
ncbi:hypothetical protein [Salinibacter ruber]|uniref:hypothetical protein n=1 Tax=Salinibacter ruber TaxID=146919 RepID=UPI00216758C9|nr:hypothetical protein [Salinibacter ruber]MCS3610968.1 hypothetical protein [Salinibacter ruber]